MAGPKDDCGEIVGEMGRKRMQTTTQQATYLQVSRRAIKRAQCDEGRVKENKNAETDEAGKYKQRRCSRQVSTVGSILTTVSSKTSELEKCAAARASLLICRTNKRNRGIMRPDVRRCARELSRSTRSQPFVQNINIDRKVESVDGSMLFSSYKLNHYIQKRHQNAIFSSYP